MRTLDHRTLQSFAATLLEHGGYPGDAARQTADLLVWANLRGVDSHGVLRIPSYVDSVRTGAIVPDAEPAPIHQFGATSVFDMRRAPGAVAMNRAVPVAVSLAATHGIGWCAARNITHAGAVGYFARQVARQGRIGIVMTASKPLMTYFGAAVPGVSTNPLSIAAPLGGEREPVLLDMSTSASGFGKILAAKDAGEPIPEGWGIDANGTITTDPAAVAALLPMAGAKGSGLSMMIEVLCSTLVGASILAPALSGESKLTMNGLVLAVDPAAFGASEDFIDAMQALSGELTALPPARGVHRVYLPGERGLEESLRRREAGIPLPEGTWLKLCSLAKEWSIETPDAA